MKTFLRIALVCSLLISCSKEDNCEEEKAVIRERYAKIFMETGYKLSDRQYQLTVDQMNEELRRACD